MTLNRTEGAIFVRVPLFSERLFVLWKQKPQDRFANLTEKIHIQLRKSFALMPRIFSSFLFQKQNNVNNWSISSFKHSGFQINDYTSNEKISKFILKVRKGQIFPGLWRGGSFTAVSSYILLVCAIAYWILYVGPLPLTFLARSKFAFSVTSGWLISLEFLSVKARNSILRMNILYNETKPC